jgi:hypothetical protein
MATLADVKASKALNLNDLADIEEQFGALDQLDLARFSVVRKILWLVIRKGEPDVTETEVGERFNVRTMQEEVNKVLKASGLLGSDEDTEGKAEAAGEV